MISATRIDAPALTHALVWMPLSAASMAPQPNAITFDALGTLVGFEPPAPHLRVAWRDRGHAVSEAAAKQAIRDEIAYYRAHLYEGGDVAGLMDLRRRSAEAMRDALPGIADDTLLAALLESLRFFAYPDVPAALGALRQAGVRIVVVSNWDASLHERLHETGLAPLVDGALASAEVGAAKPDGAIFTAALQLTGTAPHETWHVGDSPEADVVGARRAGLFPVLIARGDGPHPPADVPVIETLDELIPLALPR
jgi:putative hydrolase of the HAD superfamily